MPRLFLLACLTLTACGADGTPEPPARSGLSVTGEVQAGVVLK